ncbi:uncharacterized protein LOC133356511 [Lethenteron reissneri]|uniref:uncharacterized protein LOC133356511 n=1 Tax=Lethenteron reissneri TaxID=7753 RepID=UPI002AB78819|nr:uncharacterized protein LOC133356511 [Lethenteron reissneri]
MASVKPSVALALLVCCATAVGALPTGCTYESKDKPTTATCREFSYLSELPKNVTHLILHNSLTNVPVGSLDELLGSLTALTIEMNLTCDCNTMYLKRLAQDNLKINGENCTFLGGQKDVTSLTGNEFPDVCATAPPHCSEMLLRDSGLHIAYLVFLVPLVYSYLGLRPLVSHRRAGRHKGGDAEYKRMSNKSSSARSAPSAPPDEKIYEDLDTKL